jgi:3-oxoacyl-[acyl-carrier-protein] synthase II
MNPRIITGLGVVSAFGTGGSAFFDGMRDARPSRSAHRVETFDASKYARCPAMEVPAFDPASVLGDRGLRTLDRLSKLLIVAARLGLQHAGLKKEGIWVEEEGQAAWALRAGIVVSNAYGSLEAIHELDRVAILEDPRYINPARFPLTVSNSAAGYASIWEDVRALNVSVTNGNCGGLDAVACADMLLGSGRADVLLVGGAEALSEPLLAAFDGLGVGFESIETPTGSVRGCLGEGAALFVLETPSTARARGAEPLAEIIGYGTAFAPPPHVGSLLHPAGDALQSAIRTALDDARMSSAAVDLVVSGIAGIRLFDVAELRAIAQVMGSEACIVAPKIGLGESLGAGGAFGMASGLAYLRSESKGYVLRGKPPERPKVVLVTALGYYGNASALVMRSPSS